MVKKFIKLRFIVSAKYVTVQPTELGKADSELRQYMLYQI